MGKKRVAKKGETGGGSGKRASSSRKLSRKRLEKGILHVQATFNNTKILLSDMKGETVAWSSSGSLGFKGAKKGTPFAAAKVGETVAERAKQLSLRDVDVVVKGIGAGREASVRAFMTHAGVSITSIEDRTPQPHNGPRPPKVRRV